MEADNEVLDAALQYADLGWSVVPLHYPLEDGGCSCGKSGCRSVGKHPTVGSWTALATSDASTVSDWFDDDPDLNLGIATGGESRLVVVDLDTKDDGILNFDKLLEVHGELPPTPSAMTGSGGLHYYFLAPEGVTIRNSASKLAKGVDIRGEGGQVVAPPSIHACGELYSWIDSPTDTPPAPLPEWLCEALRERAPSPKSSPKGSLARRSIRKRTDRAFDGERNNWLTKKAGQLRNLGLDEDTILVALQAENDSKCDPPLDDDEVALIASSVSRYDPGDTPDLNSKTFQRGDDVELAQDLLSQLGECVFDEGDLYVVKDSLWSAVDQTLLESSVVRYAGAPVQSGTRTVPLKMNYSRVRGTVSMTCSLASKPGFFSENRVVAFGSTAYRVEHDGTDNGKGRVVSEPLTPEHRVREFNCQPWELDPDGSVDRVMTFLRETWAGKSDVDQRIDYLLEWLGVSLLGIATWYKDSPALVGPQDTGKSVLVELVARCFPASSRRAVSLQDLQEDTGRAALIGARLNRVSELPSKRLLEAAAVKALLAGEAVTVKKLYRDRMDVTPTCAHIFATNELPSGGDDRALLGRFAVLDCLNVVPRERKSPFLLSELSDEIPALCALAIEKAREVLSRGYIKRPESDNDLHLEWEKDSDPVAAWAGENLDEDPTGKMSGGRLYSDYAAWAKANGYMVASIRRWSRRLEAAGYKKIRVNTGMVWAVSLVGQIPQQANVVNFGRRSRRR